ncbi:unnamed protein product [Urochloa decumbens]|uniref:K Homology domain-containing protein n=1 Tax=Urochloa decumbens TaxID=240449 RepID=A0ABC9DH47_9POAL
MDRSRSKRGYHYDQDSPPPRSKQRFDRRSGGGGGQNSNSGYHRRGPPGGGGGSDRRGFLPPDAAPPPPPPPPPPPSAAAGAPGAASTTTSFRILCPECKAYGFPPGFVAKVRDDSGALVTVHPPFAGDYVRVIETVDGVRRESDGRPPMYSPAQEALLMVHRRILETEAEDGDEDGEYGPRGKDPRDRGKTTTRLIVPKLHVGCLLGKGGKIIEQMRMETKTHIRILPRDQHTPRCVSLSEEVVQGPDHELFPAQEALLHIQTQIVDLGPDKDNIITTRLLVSSSEIACFDGREGSLSDIQKQTTANVQILPREDLPLCALESDELIQIVGEIRAARNALMQVTTKLRSYLYREMSGPIQVGNINVHGAISPATGSPRGLYQGNDIPMGAYHQAPQLTASWHSRDSGGSASGSFEQGSNINDDIRQNATKRFAVPLVTRSTLEVVIPNSAVASLTMRAGSKLAQISEMSGATVKLADDRPDVLEKVVQISGTPEQTEKAKSLLQGFILSIQDDS